MWNIPERFFPYHCEQIQLRFNELSLSDHFLSARQFASGMDSEKGIGGKREKQVEYKGSAQVQMPSRLEGSRKASWRRWQSKLIPQIFVSI